MSPRVIWRDAVSSATVAYQSALYAKGWLSPQPSATDSIFSIMIENVISGRSNLDTSLSSAETSLLTLINK